MRTSWIAAAFLVIGLALWMASGLLRSDAGSEPTAQQNDEPMAVEVQILDVESMVREISLRGYLEPVRHLLLKAETYGTVKEIHVSRGARAKAGQPLVTLDLGGRQNTLAEARARVRSARSEQTAAASLTQRGLQSQLQLEHAEASLEAAFAQLAIIELDISKTVIKAPFDAIVNDLPIELGALVERGDQVAELVDDTSFIVTAQASQQIHASLRLGQRVNVELITGQSLQGTLQYISALADPQTRSFTVETRVGNTDSSIAAGVSTSVHIPVEQVDATFISPSALSLGNAGELGVKAVNDNNQVYFLPIEMISTSLDGAWVTGIPADTQVITLGQGFVNTGEVVRPTYAETTATAGQTNESGALSN